MENFKKLNSIPFLLTIYQAKHTGNKTEFYRSDDGKNSLILHSNGWPDPSVSDEQKRTEIAVSPVDEPDKVVTTGNRRSICGSGLYGIYISNDKGEKLVFSMLWTHLQELQIQ